MMGKGSRSGSDSCPVPQLTTCPNYLAGTLVSPAVFWPGRYLVLACTKVINGIALPPLVPSLLNVCDLLGVKPCGFWEDAPR